MTGQRTVIEVVRDCLRILKEANELTESEMITVVQWNAIYKLVQEHLDEILRPMYPDSIEPKVEQR